MFLILLQKSPNLKSSYPICSPENKMLQQSRMTINKDTCCFSSNALNKLHWEPIKELIVKQETVKGQKTFVNIEDFIKNGENSLLCQKIPILKDTFRFRNPLKDYMKNKFSVGDHIKYVVNHLVNENKEFQSLGSKDQELLLPVALFHDVGKKEQIIKKSLLQKEDFENAKFNNSQFDKILKSKIEELKIFNPFSDYKQKIINYFNSNPELDEVLVHNNIHRKISADLFKEAFTETPQNKKELNSINFLVEHHEDIGEEIDKFQYGYISEEVFKKTPSKIVENIKNHHDLNLIKIFHISDANGVPQASDKLSNFLKLLETITEEAHEIIDKSR